MLKPILIVVMACIFCSFAGFSQETSSGGKVLYLELGGKGFFSANVDFPLGDKSRLSLGATVLDNEFAKEENEEEHPNLVLPHPSIMYFRLFGREKHYFETGIGVSISPIPWREYSPDDSPWTLHGSLGYRYQQPDHFFFRAAFTPFYRVNWMFLPLVGLSFGYSW
jgi:hypothetical protein